MLEEIMSEAINKKQDANVNISIVLTSNSVKDFLLYFKRRFYFWKALIEAVIYF